MDQLKMYENVGFPASRASRFPARLDRTGYPGQLIHLSPKEGVTSTTLLLLIIIIIIIIIRITTEIHYMVTIHSRILKMGSLIFGVFIVGRYSYLGSNTE